MARKSHSFHTILPLLFAILCFFLGSPAFGQLTIYENGQPTLVGADASVHADILSRRKIDLAGMWSYSTDNENWKEVKVPSSFDYQGRLTFVRRFTLDRSTVATSAVQLVAFGINHDAEIFVNDVFVGRHSGGYTTIDIDLPESALQLGSENTIKIIVNTSLSARSTLPVRKQIWGWRNYGGILRDIYLLVTPRLWIDRVTVKSSLSNDLSQGSLDVVGVLNSRPGTGPDDTLSALVQAVQPLYAIDVLDKATGAVVGQSAPQPVSVLPNRDYEVSASVIVKAPRAWSPETPDLYLLRAKIFVQQGKLVRMIDEYNVTTGFRKFESDKDNFFLNGRQVVLRGIVWHEDAPGSGASLTYEQMEKDVVLMKTLGANAVRFAFHPPHPYVLNLCDRYGLLALVEIPVVNVPAEILDQEQFKVLAESAVGDMISRDQHHPAIVGWGLGDNLDPSDPRTCSYIERVVGTAKKFDKRPVYVGNPAFTEDQCAGSTDIAATRLPNDGINALKGALRTWKSSHQDRPVVLLAYGKDVEPENRSGWSDPMSQEAQAEFFKKAYAVIKDAKIAGSFIDSFADWRGDRPLMSVSAGDRTLYPVGLLSYAREKRAAFDMVKLLYNGEKTVALPIGRYRATFPFAHIVWGFAIIFVMAYMYHYNRRFNETFKRALIRSYNFFADLRDVRSVSIPQTILLAVAVSATLGVMISGILYRYRTDVFADFLLTSVVVSDGLKENLISATWRPFEGILVFSGILLLWYPLAALCIKLFAPLVKRRVYWYHAFSIAVWGSLPIVLLSPVAMALFKILQTDFYVPPAFLLIAVFVAWSFLRTLKGVAVIYDISRVKAYGGGILVVLIVLGGLFVYYESTYALSATIEHLLHIGRSVS